jgi:hypothetical protein
MAVKKISELPLAQALQAGDDVVVLRGGNLYKMDAGVLAGVLAGFELAPVTVTATAATQEFYPDPGRGFSSVTVNVDEENLAVTMKKTAQTLTNPGGYFKTVTVPSGVAAPGMVQNEPVVPTGTYATATYYNVSYGVKLGYMADGDILLSMRSGSSTSYEYLYFNLASAPPTLTLTAANSFVATSYTSAAPGDIYACVLSGVTKPVNIEIAMTVQNATYDWVRCDITVTEA